MKPLTPDLVIEWRTHSKAARILSHLLFWVVVFSSSFYFIKSSYDPYRDTALSYLSPMRNTLGIALFFYPLMYWLTPRFLLKKKWVLFLAGIISVGFVYVLFEAIGEKMVFQFCGECRLKAQELNPDYLSVIQKALIDNILFKASQIGLIFNLFSGLILPIAIKSSLGYYRIYSQNLQFARDKAQLELNFLKAQVNPHFLFNTLNNLYGSILAKRTEQSAEIVSRLSGFMRYSLQNVDRKSILLSEEMDLINDYIELEKLRLNHTQVSFHHNIRNTTRSIPPLLFIPLIENAFKYHTDIPDNLIVISIKDDTDFIHFTCTNNFDPEGPLKDSGGFGLSNLRRRLALYFGKNYVLSTSRDRSTFSVQLKFPVS